VPSMKSALIIYFSSTGNTQKVACAIKEGLEKEGVKIDLKKPQEAADLPSIEWQPAKQMVDLLKAKLNLYRNQGKIKPCAPKVAGKNVWFSAPIQDRTQALMRQRQEAKP
jgi:hypothetical protein